MIQELLWPNAARSGLSPIRRMLKPCSKNGERRHRWLFFLGRLPAHSCHNIPAVSMREFMAKTRPISPSPLPSRVMITEMSDCLRLVIPYSRSWFVIGFLGFWLCAWVVAEVLIPLRFLEGEAPSGGWSLMIVWFVVWTVAGVLAVYAWLWQVMGKEIVTVRDGSLTLRRDVGGFGLDKVYDLDQVRELRAEPALFDPMDLSMALQLWGIGGGAIAFDYEGKTRRFGIGLDETEAKQAVAAIKKRWRAADRSHRPASE